MGDSGLPRLLYWADLPVCPTGAGAILMHRLLEAWPPEKLMVVTPGAVSGCPLPGVRKAEAPPSKLSRLWRTRFGTHCMSAATLAGMAAMKLRGGRAPAWLRQAVREFQPQAILTVGIAGAWIHAAGLARHLGVPLHVLVHDDHHYAYFWIPQLRGFGERLFGKVYRQAVSRLCISGPMEREYAERFGAEGDVLLPSRGRNSVFFREPSSRVGLPLAQGKIFYAGSVYGKGFGVLDEVAIALKSKGHRLIIYTPNEPPKDFRPQALEIRGPLPSTELVRALHEEADLLLLMTNFEEANRDTVRTLFPSKIVDYTASAVPILVAAPEYACILDYLGESPDAAAFVTSEAPASVSAAVDELMHDAPRRQRLARGAVAAGERDFSYAKAWEKFAAAMGKKQPRGRAVTSGV